MANVRAIAAETLYQVVDKGVSLSQLMPSASLKVPPQDKALLQQLCYGVLRYLPSLEHYCQKLLAKPLKGKQRVFQFLLYVGIYQLQHMRVPDHAAVGETVDALECMRATGMKGLINAILRSFQRQQAELEGSANQIDACKYNHPGWLLKKLQAAYPQTWQEIVSANQTQAPMWLRVNQAQYSTKEYQRMLARKEITAHRVDGFEHALLLEQPIDVSKLPEFKNGACSVQDGAAQLAASLLQCEDGEYVLDACAAPGGKTCHMLELAECTMVALDHDAERLEKVQQNLDRIKLSATLTCADASNVDAWWDGTQFDRILLDVPCSATGVIRRHPDIKWLRRASDIEQLAQVQAQMLDKIWPLLKTGGTLLYATCSVLPEENAQQVAQFLARTQNAKLVPLHADDTPERPGWQLLPSTHDGFYYAKLIKQ